MASHLGYHAWMRIYAFSSITEPMVRCYTVDPIGDNLASQFAPWRDLSIMSMPHYTEEVKEAISRDGYFCIGVSGNDHGGYH
jgi:hypothetical protein